MNNHAGKKPATGYTTNNCADNGALLRLILMSETQCRKQQHAATHTLSLGSTYLPLQSAEPPPLPSPPPTALTLSCRVYRGGAEVEVEAEEVGRAALGGVGGAGGPPQPTSLEGVS